MKQNARTLPKLLRAMASGTDAKSAGTDIILVCAAEELERRCQPGMSLVGEVHEVIRDFCENENGMVNVGEVMVAGCAILQAYLRAMPDVEKRREMLERVIVNLRKEIPC